MHGLERLPAWDPAQAASILVANHRSFFDLYVTAAELVARGLPHRILFPVRSTFFYDHPLGPFVNGAMSFFAMYPPIFRERKRASLNLASLDEAAALLRRGGFFVGLHPEGTRKKDDDPYTFLPAQSGVGRIIHKARVPVIPVFVNGLGNDLPKQVAGGPHGLGPADSHGLRRRRSISARSCKAPGGPRAYRRIAERCIEAIGELGREEKAIRGSSAERAGSFQPEMSTVASVTPHRPQLSTVAQEGKPVLSDSERDPCLRRRVPAGRAPARTSDPQPTEVTGAPDPAAPATGQVLAGKYRVERVLGTGGMGVVVAARHIQLDAPVALKFMTDEALADHALVTRFLREARATARLARRARDSRLGRRRARLGRSRTW